MINIQVQPVSISSLQTVTKINETVYRDCRMSIWMIAETVNADKETVGEILQDELNIKKVCVKLVQKIWPLTKACSSTDLLRFSWEVR